MKQRTFDGELTASAPHPEDKIFCSDGSVKRRGDAFADYNGDYHPTNDRMEMENMLIVHRVVDDIAVAVEEYTKHHDYSEMYEHIIHENHTKWGEEVGDWLFANLNIECDGVVDAVCEQILGYALWEPIYDYNEFNHYQGNGVCLYSVDVGEIEEQVDITTHPVLRQAYNDGMLEHYLESYNGDAHLSAAYRYDRKSGQIVKSGYVRGSVFYMYLIPGGQWQFVVSETELYRVAAEQLAILGGFNE